MRHPCVVAFSSILLKPSSHVHDVLPAMELDRLGHGVHTPRHRYRPAPHATTGAGVGAGVGVVVDVVRGGVVLELLFRLPASERRDGRQRKRRAKATRCHAFDRGLGGGERERPGDGTRLTGSASPIRGCWCCKIAPSADLPAFKVWVAVNPKLCQAL